MGYDTVAWKVVLLVYVLVVPWVDQTVAWTEKCSMVVVTVFVAAENLVDQKVAVVAE